MVSLARALAVVLAFIGAGARGEVTVFAAASLNNAFEAVGKVYREQSGERVRFSFASTSTLARQIEAGAPAQLFASADQAWMDWAVERRLIVAATRTALLTNRLVLVTPRDRPLTVDIGSGFDLAAVLGRRGRLAMGDPAHVPAGRYARQALESIGAWELAEARLVRADNVRVALALVERGEVPAGIVYASDAAVAPGVHVAGVFPASSHERIVYPVAVVRGGDSPEARALLRFLRGERARAIYRRFGFAVID